MKNLMVGGLIACALGLFPPATKACFCIMPEVSEAVEQASAVFVGEVTEIVGPISKDDKAPPGRFYVIKFKVEKSWKGVTFVREISVLSAQGADECFAFPAVHKGEKYLVFADPFYSKGTLMKQWSIMTTCNRTKLLGTAAADLKRLGSPQMSSLEFPKRRKR